MLFFFTFLVDMLTRDSKLRILYITVLTDLFWIWNIGFSIRHLHSKKNTLFFILNHVENRSILLLSTQGFEQI